MPRAGHWNQNRIPGIFGAGGRTSGAAVKGPEAKGKCVPSHCHRRLMLFAAAAAQAKVSITVDKNAQMMTVAVDGVERYRWPVSTGNPSHETPNGSFRTFRMEEDHYSKEFDDAPMPHSIFFTKSATPSTAPNPKAARHPGFPWLRAAVARQCLDAVRAGEKEGVLNTTVTLTGSSQMALARNPRVRATPPSRAAIRRRNSRPIRCRRRSRGADAAAAAPGRAAGRSAATTATSIRPTAARTRRAIRRRAAIGDATTRRTTAASQYYYSDQADYGHARPYAPQVYAPRPLSAARHVSLWIAGE